MRSGMKLSLIPDPCTVLSFPGETFKIEYSLVTSPSIDLVESGRFDIRQMIQSYSEFTDMSYIMARLAAGDASVLAFHGNPMYGDFSSMPVDHREVLQTVMDARTYFDHLSDEVKTRFDNDFGKWISSAGSLDWVNLMTGKKPDSNSIVEKQPDSSTVVEPVKEVK